MRNIEKILSTLPDKLKPLMHRQASLRKLTTLNIGGPASVLFEVQNTDQALRFQEIALHHEIPLFVLGGGSNLLASDDGYPGIVLKIATEDFSISGNTLTAGAGLGFDNLIERSLQAKLTGLEFASGIPGTLGGAIVGNAGCYGHEISEFLVEAITLGPDGLLQKRGPEDFGFKYRSTSLRESGEILLQATLTLHQGNVDSAFLSRNEKINDRLRKHPQNLPSAGSWFRNLPAPGPGQRRVAAGSLLEKAGAKEMSAGDAQVFSGHANMIVNTGEATSAQVKALAQQMKKAVADQFQVELIQEVRHLE